MGAGAGGGPDQRSGTPSSRRSSKSCDPGEWVTEPIGSPARPGSRSVRFYGESFLISERILSGSGNSPLPYRSTNRTFPSLSTMNVARTLAFQSGQ